jgi:hypothetical protein
MQFEIHIEMETIDEIGKWHQRVRQILWAIIVAFLVIDFVLLWV